jgi:hypothetical protein
MIFFVVVGVRNPDLTYYYALSIPIELSSEEQRMNMIIIRDTAQRKPYSQICIS